MKSALHVELPNQALIVPYFGKHVRAVDRLDDVEVVITAAAEVADKVETELDSGLDVGVVIVVLVIREVVSGAVVLDGVVPALDERFARQLPYDGLDRVHGLTGIGHVFIVIHGIVVPIQRHRVDREFDRALAGEVAHAAHGDRGGAGFNVVRVAEDLVILAFGQVVGLLIIAFVIIIRVKRDFRRLRLGVIDDGADARVDIVDVRGVDDEGDLRRAGEGVAERGDDRVGGAGVDVLLILERVVRALVERFAAVAHGRSRLAFAAVVGIDRFAVGPVALGQLDAQVTDVVFFGIDDGADRLIALIVAHDEELHRDRSVHDGVRLIAQLGIVTLDEDGVGVPAVAEVLNNAAVEDENGLALAGPAEEFGIIKVIAHPPAVVDVAFVAFASAAAGAHGLKERAAGRGLLLRRVLLLHLFAGAVVDLEFFVIFVMQRLIVDNVARDPLQFRAVVKSAEIDPEVDHSLPGERGELLLDVAVFASAVELKPTLRYLALDQRLEVFIDQELIPG